MRVTNNMIMKNAASNINATKEQVDTKNTQMTSQKKISKPSEDPVVAVRSLRLSTTLSQVNQYYEKNIPDATSWLDVTESSLLNMRDAMVDCRTIAVKGATDSLSQTDRSTIYTQLSKLQSAIYDEGNADYAGRTVFTGYRTDSNLTFTEQEDNTSYDITQSFSIGKSMEEYRYYDGIEKLPTTLAEVAATDNICDVVETKYYRVRLGYDQIDNCGLQGFSFKFGKGSMYAGSEIKVECSNTTDPTTGASTYSYPDTINISKTDSTGTTTTDVWNFKIYRNESEWADATPDTIGKELGPKDLVFIEETGQFIFGSEVTSELMENDITMDTTYTKTGFDDGELRPEFYYNCVKTKDPNDSTVPVTYKKFDEEGAEIKFDIQYTVAMGQTININTEASDVFDSSIQRDLGEMMNAVNRSIEAHDKLETLKAMKSEAQYASDECQAQLDKWITATKKEADFADDNMQKLYDTEIGKIDAYYAKINLAITDLGCKADSLQLTKTRVGDQQETVQDLRSKNDDIDISQIIIEYTAAYTAYQSSLTAAGKLGDVSLLKYI